MFDYQQHSELIRELEKKRCIAILNEYSSKQEAAGTRVFGPGSGRTYSSLTLRDHHIF